LEDTGINYLERHSIWTNFGVIAVHSLIPMDEIPSLPQKEWSIRT